MILPLTHAETPIYDTNGYVFTGYETPKVEGDSPPQHTYEEIDNVVKSVPGKKLHEQPLYQNQSATERPIPLTELASYINRMTKTKDGFKKDFEVRLYDNLPESE